ncbi:MAG: oligosaccharide flippase family protein [Chlamydiota bacterium]|nr:oligosaccharide flippase family protein [Chlamydiota bacterium]
MNRQIDFLITRLRTSTLLKSSMIMFVSTQIANVSAYVFQFCISRMLGVILFGTYNSLLSLYCIIVIPTQVIMMVVARYTANFYAKQEKAKLYLFIRNSFLLVLLLGALILGSFFMFAPLISGFLKLDRAGYLILVGIIASLSYIVIVGAGYLQGIQKFFRLGGYLAGMGLVRLIGGVLLVWWGFGVYGALTGSILGFSIVIVIFWSPLKELFTWKEEGVQVERHTREIFQYSIPVMLAALSFHSYIYIDLVLVKHFFSVNEVGHYAAAAVLGRAVFYFSTAIAFAMFPKIAEAEALGQNSFIILKKALLMTGVLSFVAFLILSIFPGLMIRILFGHGYELSFALLPVYALAMVPLSLSNLMVQFCVARKDFMFIGVLVAGLFLLCAGIGFFHSSLTRVIWILAICNSLVAFCLGGLIFIQSRLTKNP